jgi:glycosyltransferase involved in cell wall biosynthesis|tara:strand:- start:2839 stop:3759 length:921 start_codon:yes stop_codon:yes gene_type:complete
VSSVKASVIVAVYNGAKTLTQTIESILSQTYDNFELLLIDDGSTDESKNLIEKYLEDERVKYFKKQNGGVASARNFGIARATGEVIGFCDQDDQWLPQKLEKQIPLFSDPDVGLVYSWVDIDRHGKRECSTPEFEGECFEALLNRNFVSCCTAMVRRTVLNQVNGLDESRELHGVDDRHLWLKVARISKLAVAKTPLAIYFIHGENYSLDNKKMLIADLSCIEKIASIEDLTPREKSLCKNAKYNAYKHYANNFLYRNSPQLSASCFLSAWKVKPWHLESLVAASLLSVMPSNLLIKLKQTKNRVQ